MITSMLSINMTIHTTCYRQSINMPNRTIIYHQHSEIKLYLSTIVMNSIKHGV